MALPDLTQNLDGSTTLRVPQGGALIFSATWYDDDDEVVPITNATGAVRDNDTDTVQLDLDDYITVVGGAVTVNVPASVTADLEEWGAGYWNFRIEHDGDVLFLMEGPATLRPGAQR